MIDQKRREMFSDLYRVAEFYEEPPFQPGDIDGNSSWFVMSYETVLKDFLIKYKGDQLACELVSAIVEDASRRAAEANKQVSVV